MTRTETLHVGLAGIRVGDTILGTPQRTIVDMRRIRGGGRSLTLSDGTTRTLTLGDELTILREAHRPRGNSPRTRDD